MEKPSGANAVPIIDMVSRLRSRLGRAAKRYLGKLPGQPPDPIGPSGQPPIDPFDAIPVSRISRDTTATTRPIVEAVDPASLESVWPYRRDQGHLGQLSPDSQEEYLRRFEPLNPAHCHWYHEIPTADGERIVGAWDLNGNEAVYLGHVDFDGKRVFELGPATGQLTWWMEGEGAEVVAFEAGLDQSNDLIPYGRTVTAETRDNAMSFVAAVQRSWWWTKVEHQLRASVAYGSVYNLPEDLGEFDITVLGAVLLHLRDPFGAMMQVAARTNDTIVVTDLEPPRPWSPTEMRFNPVEGDHSSWWVITPGAMGRMLSNVGFGEQTITRHTQWHRPGHVASAEPIEMSMYTIVARRD